MLEGEVRVMAEADSRMEAVFSVWCPVHTSPLCMLNLQGHDEVSC